MLRMNTDAEKVLVDYFMSASKNADASFEASFKSCVMTNLKYILTFFVLSMTIYSSWLCVAVSGIKGFMAGFTATFLIKNYGTYGVIYTVLAIAPSTFIMIPVLLFGAVVCINFAADRRKNKAAGMKSALKIVVPLIIIYSAMTVCSLYDSIITPLIFKNLF